MKRLIPIVLVLLVLTACGAPADVPSPAASPDAVPAQMPEPAALSLPPVDFAPESCYLAEEFGDRGQALLLMSADGQFKCRYSCWVEIPETGATELMCGSFTDSEATAAIDGDVLTLGYAEEADYPRPERFTRVPENEAIEAHMNMPFNDETVFPIPVRISHAELEAMTGVELVREENGEGGVIYSAPQAELRFNPLPDSMLLLSSVKCTGGQFLPEVRGITIGMSLEDVLSRFPDGPVAPQYGTDSGQIYGGFYDGANLSVRADADEYNGRTQLTAYGGGQSVRYIFDSDDNVEAVIAYTGA